jgi:hypothetical protein
LTKRGRGASSSNALVGTWKQEPNRAGSTSVAYTILVEHGRFTVKGQDEEGGTPLKVSRVQWDGKSLHFVTIFGPTGHKAKHVVKVLSKGKMSHRVSGIYADGEVFSDDEIWRKIPDTPAEIQPPINGVTGHVRRPG